MTSDGPDRRSLPRTFGPWFGRFRALTEVQRQAIPPLLAGRDVLVCSATASGKTEAYAAPAAELTLARGAASAAVVIVSPTRALANDLRRRLEGPFGLVGLTFGRYTGEHKERRDGALPAVVVTTPEALDSLLARRPRTLAATRIVVLDEIHVLDNTPRGDQLRVLLHRLGRVAEHPLQRVAASATVDRPEELARRYLTDPVVVAVPGIRRILGRAFEGDSVPDLALHLDDLAGYGLKKILVFCRSRNQVETYASKLPGRTRFEERVFAHHGSLAQTVRERTERLFHQAGSGVCFATLTLEMGIDIGTVDYVLMVGVPSDVPAVLQRIGRGGRRGETTRAGYVVANAADRHLFETMLTLGREGRLCGAPYAFRPGVLVQQALVTAGAQSWIEVADLEAMLPPTIRTDLGAGACAALLDAACEKGLLERGSASRFVPSEDIERRHLLGTLHSNIDDEAGVDVVDRLTGDVIGRIGSADTGKIEIGGSERRVVHSRGGRILTDKGTEARPARFEPRGTPTASFALGRAIVAALGVGDGAVDLVSVDGSWVLLHGFGTAGAAFLVRLLKDMRAAPAVETFSPYVVRLTGELRDLPRPADDTVASFIDGRLDGLEKLASPGPWGRVVPRELRLEFVRKALGLSDVAEFLCTARLVRRPGVADERLAAVLGDL